MDQMTIESLLPVTEGLECICCGEHSVMMTSLYSERLSCYYIHEAICQSCGYKTSPTGIKDFILKHWEETNKSMRDYFKFRYKEDPYKNYLEGIKRKIGG